MLDYIHSHSMRLSILFIFLFSGCGLWENFTTYFNLYYNTKDIFDRAEETIYQNKKPLFSPDESVIPGTVSQELNKVIEKSSVILQFHSESGYVDNALLMLGKSFYYQNNHLKALRKFQELIATRPESDLILETRLWIGKTQLKLRNYEDAFTSLRDLRKEEEVPDEIIRDAYAEEIKFRISREEFPPAVEMLKEFLSRTSDDEIISEINYELGNLYVSLDQVNDAIASYEQVFNYSPTYEVELRTRIELGKALRATGKEQQALEIFEQMSTENKYSESFDAIELEKGITLKDLKSYDEAVQTLKKVDTSYAAASNAAVARYHLGEIFETVYRNFDSAAVYYQKAVSSNAPQEYLAKAGDKSQLFKKYMQIRSLIKENEKKLLYINNPEEFVKDSAAYFTSLADSSEIGSSQMQPGTEIDSRRNQRTGTRRVGRENEKTTESQQVQTARPPQRPDIPADSVKNILVKSKYELGNLFFTEFNLPDSAFLYYTGTLNEFPNSTYQGRILYALGSYYEISGNHSKADSLYNFIYENYKNERIVNAAGNKLNKPLVDFDFDPAVDLYSEAEQYLLREDYATSLNKFLDISSRYPKSPYAAKALFAGGWIMENKLSMPDSAAAVYDTITVKYPHTLYASQVKPKLNFYRQEKIRVQKAAEDSIRNEQMKLDSLERSDSLSSFGKIPADSLKSVNIINENTDDGNIPSQGPAAHDSTGINTDQIKTTQEQKPDSGNRNRRNQIKE